MLHFPNIHLGEILSISTSVQLGRSPWSRNIPVLRSLVAVNCRFFVVICVWVAVRICWGSQVTAYQIQIDSWHVTPNPRPPKRHLHYKAMTVGFPCGPWLGPSSTLYHGFLDCRVTFSLHPFGLRAGVELASWFALPGHDFPFTNFYVVVVAGVIASTFAVRK